MKNYNIAAKKKRDDILFLRKIVRGGADQSYGIEVAKLAGVPEPVLRRARKILEELEAGVPAAPPRPPYSRRSRSPCWIWARPRCPPACGMWT